MADIVNLYTSTSISLSTLQLHMLHVTEGYLPERDAPEMSQQLFQLFSEYVSNPPQRKGGEMALLLNTAEYTFYRLSLTVDITRELQMHTGPKT